MNEQAQAHPRADAGCWLIDAGNTRVKLCTQTGAAGLGPVRQLDYDGLESLLAEAPPARVHVACVARPERRAALAALLPVHSHWAQTPALGLGIRCAYADHRKWGVDRWLALAAAHRRAATDGGGTGAAQTGAAGVLDIGTATTFDACAADGRHLGGWIAPGPRALIEALGGHTALPAAAAELPARLHLACDTEEAILLGALQSAVGGLERAATAAAAEGIGPLWLTGGGAPLLAPYLDATRFRLAEHLVLEGLRLLAAAEGS